MRSTYTQLNLKIAMMILMTATLKIKTYVAYANSLLSLIDAMQSGKQCVNK